MVQPVEPVRKVNVNVRLLKADLDVPRPWWSAEEYRKSIIPGYVPEYEPLVDYSEVEREKRREKVRRFFEGVERGWGVVVVGAWGVVRLVLGAVLALVWLVVWAFGGDVRGWR